MAILELLSNDSPMPLLAAALCSLLGQCPVPAGHGREIAELQQNLAKYVQENESMISSASEHDPNNLTPEDHKPQVSDEMTPPREVSMSGMAMEPGSTSHNPYQPMDGSHNYLFQKPSNVFEKSSTIAGSFGADIASVAEDINLTVIIDCMKGTCVEMPPHDLFKGYLANCNGFF